MTVERTSEPDMRTALTRFVVMDFVVVAAFTAFLIAFFVLNTFPGQPVFILVVGVVAFVGATIFAFVASGFWAAIRKQGDR